MKDGSKNETQTEARSWTHALDQRPPKRKEIPNRAGSRNRRGTVRIPNGDRANETITATPAAQSRNRNRDQVQSPGSGSTKIINNRFKTRPPEAAEAASEPKVECTLGRMPKARTRDSRGQ